MNSVLRLAIVDPNDNARSALKNMLLGMDVIWLEAECSRYEFFSDVVSQTQPDVGVIALDADREKAMKLIAQLKESSPNCAILVTSATTDGQLILQSMRLGAREFLTLPLKPDDLAAALDRVGSAKVGGEKNKGCTVIAVCGTTGGVGSTSLAVNLGCMFAHNKRNSAVLVDLDMALGDADVFLDTIPDYSLIDVAQNIARLDFQLLKKSLTKHASGLYLLPRPVQLQDGQSIRPDDIHRMIGFLKASFSHLIIDLSKGFTAVDMVALKAANHVLMVTQLDLPCLRNVVRLMSSFHDVEGLIDKVKICVNRVGLDSGQISLRKAQETMGRDVYWQIPNDYRTMVEVRNNGVPLVDHAPRAAITHAIGQLADALNSGKATEKAAPDKAGGGGIGRWLGIFSGKPKSEREVEEKK